MTANPAPEFNYEKCLAQAKARCATVLDTTNNLTGWTLSTGTTIPPSMKIYERRDGMITF
jgi:hypothetical protein